MGIVLYPIPISILFLAIHLLLSIFKAQLKALPKHSHPSKSIHTILKISSSLYNYLSVHHIISLSSVTIYIWYEYVEKGCVELECVLSET
jgi:hypothetical protein